MVKYPWRLFIGSSVSGLSEKIQAKDSIRKKIFFEVDRIYKEDNTRNRLNKINTDINPAADLLD